MSKTIGKTLANIFRALKAAGVALAGRRPAPRSARRWHHGETLEPRILLSATFPEAVPELPFGLDAAQAVVAVVAAQASAQATPTISWTASVSGFWDDATNWRDANGVARAPTAADDVLIDVAGATPTVTLRTSVAAHSLLARDPLSLDFATLTLAAASEVDARMTVSNTSLVVNGTLTTTGQSDWSGVGLYGTAHLVNAGTLTLAGGNNLSATLDNTGTLVETGSGIRMDDFGVGTLNNSGVFDLRSDAAFTQNYADSPSIINSGTVRKSAGSGTATVAVAFINHGGTIDAQAGTLAVTAGTQAGGIFNTSSGAVLQFSGAETFSGSFSGSGAGQVRLAPGISIYDRFSVGPGGATFDFASPEIQWVSGSIFAGSDGLTNLGQFTIAPNASGVGLFGTWNNSGAIVQSGSGAAFIDFNATVTNSATGTWDFQGDGSLHPGGRSGASDRATFINQGSLSKSTGTGVSSITGGAFSNAGGKIAVTSGTLSLGSAGGFSSGGSFDVAAGATLDLTGGQSVSYAGAYTGSGQGTVLLASGALVAGPGGANFNLPGPLFQWTGGAIVGGVTGFTNAGTITLSGNGTKYIANLVDNRGTLVDQAGTLQLDYFAAGTLSNRGLVDVRGDNAFVLQAQGDTINNAGTFLKSAGSGTATVAAAFNNQGGTVDVRAGTLVLNSGTQTGGRFDAASGAVLELTGSHTFSGTISGAGAGVVRLVGDRYTAGASGAVLDFQPSLLHWNSGFLDGGSAGLVNLGALTRIDEAGASRTGSLMRGRIDNAGTFIQSGLNAVDIDNGGVFTNRVGALVDLQGDGYFIDTNFIAGVGHAFINQGTLRKSAGTLSNLIVSDFDNAGGTLDVEAGTLALARGHSSGGSFHVAADAVLDLADSSDGTGSAKVVYSGHYTGSGAGTVLLARNVLAAGASGASFDLPDGMFQWTGGAIDGGAAGFDNQGTITLAGSATKFIGGLVINEGTVNHQAGNLQFDYSAFSATIGGTLRNNGLWELQGDASFTRQYLAGGVALHNAGTLRKSAGAGVSGAGDGMPFDNTGSLEVRSGTFALAAFSGLDPTVTQISGQTLTGGSWTVGAGATLRLPTITINQGNITLDGAGSKLDAINGLTQNTGSLTLTGGRSFNTAGDFANGGTLTLGPASTLAVAGNFQQSAGAMLISQIGGSPASGQFGRLTSSGGAALAGAFDVSLANGFGPTRGDLYPVLQFASYTGAFTSLGGLTDGRGTLFTANLDATTFSLSAATTVSDLAVDAIAITIPALSPGQTASIGYTVRNKGATAASGDWYDSVYLSSDATLDPADTLLGRVHHVGDVAGSTSYHETLSAPLPALLAGAYKLIVVADSRGLVPDADRANNTAVSAATLSVSIPTLTLGVLAKGDLVDGQDTYYHLVVPPAANLDLAETFSSLPGAEVYLRYGGLPDRTVFDQSATDPTQANPKLTLANAQGGDYFILLHGRASGGAPQAYTLTASASKFAVAAIDPAISLREANQVITLDGSQFTTHTTVALIASNSAVYQATRVAFIDSTRLQATFDLSAVPLGSYTVQASDNGQSATASTAFEVTDAVVGNFASTTILSPARVRVGAPIAVTVTVHGLANSFVPIPFLQVDATNVASDQHLQLADPNLPQFLAPGQSLDIGHIYTPAPKVAHTISSFDLTAVNLLQTIDWDAQKEQMRPKSVSAEAWDAVWANLRPLLGNIIGDYYRLLRNDAAALRANGAPTSNINHLLGFEIMKANNQMQSPVTPASVDLAFPAPGLSLAFARSFAGDSIAGRYALGRLGRGWVDDFDASASADAATHVVTIRQGQLTRYFAPGASGFVGLPGDTGALSLVGGAYQLRELSGGLTVFRGDGSLDYLQDANGNRITAGYSGALLTSLTHSDGDVMALAYNAQGRVRQVTDPTGRSANYAYDASGQQLQSVTTAAGITQYTYTADATGPRAHALTSITSPAGAHIFFDYDSRGRLASEQLDGADQALHYSYSSASVRITDALNRAVNEFFDDAGRVVSTESPLGTFNFAQYDGAGRVTRVAAQGGGSTDFGYDARGNVKTLVDPTGARQGFAYDPGHNGLNSFTDARGSATSFNYDPAGNPAQTKHADGSTASFAFDSSGNLVQAVDRNGQVTRTTYDSHGLATQVQMADGSVATYAYDAHANLGSATDANGTITMSYDAADRVTKVSYPGGRFLQYSYNAGGQRTQMTDQSGFTTHYAYDATGRLASLTDASNQPIARYSYDVAGNLMRKDQGSGAHSDYAYDANRQLLQIVNFAADGSVNSSFDYSYDILGRRTSVTSQDGTTTYGYDGDARLTSVALPGGRTITYRYDAAGNRVQVDDGGAVTAYTSNSINEYTAVGATTNSFDAAGNLAASVGSAGATSYGYDTLGRLTSAANASGLWRYEYNALGQRTASIHNGVRTEYLVDPSGLGNVVGTYDGAGALTAHYTYGLGLTSQVDGAGNAGYYDFDATGSTVGLAGATGGYVNRYSYLPFGEVQSASESVANPFQFGGAMGVQADGSGLDFMRARYYDAASGRFTQPDPIGLGGGANLYAYAANSPVAEVDPSGMVPIFGPTFPATAENIALLAEAMSRVFGYISPLAVEYGAPVVAEAAVTAETVGGVALGSGNLLATNITHLGLNYAQFAPQVEAAAQSLATAQRLTAAALAAPTAIEALGIGAIVFGVGVSFWSSGSIQYAEYYKASHNGQLPACSRLLPAALKIFTACDSAPVIPASALGESNSEQVSPSDPNFIAGPAGFGSAQFVRGDATFPYQIGFENMSSASAPAQQVVITEQLDPNLDLTTFALGSFGFGGITVDVPAGRQFFSTRLDQRATLGLFVDATAALDVATRTVTWTLTSIDPKTLDIPADVEVGFLPPDDSAGHGQGYVSYFAKPATGLASGTAIQAQASIVFDTNAAVPTNLFSNTLDNGAPGSAVAALPAVTSTPSFTLHWSGSDEAGGSGIASYDIYVSTDGGSYGLLQDHTTQTSAPFAGQPGHRYAFYSVARDNAGHLEAAPTAADSETRILGGLLVTSALSDASGVAVRFNQALDPTLLNLYATQTGGQGPADVTLVGATTGPVTGSLVLDQDLMGLRFVRTGGPLTTDTYTLTLRSAANGFIDTGANLLDGNTDGTPGGNYVQSFSITASGALLSIPDIARGPGQSVDQPATASGLPVTLSNAVGANRVDFTLEYNAALLSVAGVALGTGAPAGSTLSTDLSQAGRVVVSVNLGAPITSASARELVRIQAAVPLSVADRYGQMQVLDLKDVSINAGAMAVRADDAVFVNAYVGDANANRGYDAPDVQLLQRVVVRFDTGLAAYPLLDPAILGDTTGNGIFNSLDLQRLQQRVVGLAPASIPALPAPVLPLSPFAAPAPSLKVPNADAVAGAMVIDQSAVGPSLMQTASEPVVIAPAALPAAVDTFTIERREWVAAFVGNLGRPSAVNPNAGLRVILPLAAKTTLAPSLLDQS